MIDTYSMKQPDVYYLETIKMKSQAILCELLLGLWRHFYGFKIV